MGVGVRYDSWTLWKWSEHCGSGQMHEEVLPWTTCHSVYVCVVTPLVRYPPYIHRKSLCCHNLDVMSKFFFTCCSTSDHETIWPSPHCEANWRHHRKPCVDHNGAMHHGRGEKCCLCAWLDWLSHYKPPQTFCKEKLVWFICLFYRGHVHNRSFSRVSYTINLHLWSLGRRMNEWTNK